MIITRYLIVDTTTGAMNGFFFERSEAKAAFDRAKGVGAATLVLCEVLEDTGSHPIHPGQFWATHPTGWHSPLNDGVDLYDA